MNPSKREGEFRTIIISHIVRCPKANSKRCANLCRLCEFFIAGNEKVIACSFPKQRGKKLV